VRFYCHVSRGGAASPTGGISSSSSSSGSGGSRAGTISTGSASAFYDDDDGEEDLMGGGGGGSAYAPPVGMLSGGAPSGEGLTDDLAMFAGMGGGGGAAGAAGPAVRSVFNHDNLHVTMAVEKNPMKVSSVRCESRARAAVRRAVESTMVLHRTHAAPAPPFRLSLRSTQSNACRITLTASTVVGEASGLKMMCAVPKSVGMTIGAFV
jgi:hypothetical protein